MAFTNEEMTDMVKVMGFCSDNLRACVREYAERFPNRRTPNRQTFARVERTLRETGGFVPIGANRGRPRVLGAGIEEQILDRVVEDPNISTRRLALQLNVSKSGVNRVLREQQLHPYHVTKVHEILPPDYDRRLNFCNFIQNKRVEDPNFHHKILFTDEAGFTRTGIFNSHNFHEYAEENPHAKVVKHFQREFRVNVWAGIINNFVVGPVFLPRRLTGENYLAFLREDLPELMDDLPLLVRANMWFLHDGAPPHYTLDVHQFLNNTFPQRWIGRRGRDVPVEWPARSPDLTPMDYFFWGALKNKVYATPVGTEQELILRIQQEFNILKNDQEMLGRTQFNFLRRVQLCIRENGGHFEHLL